MLSLRQLVVSCEVCLVVGDVPGSEALVFAVRCCVGLARWLFGFLKFLNPETMFSLMALRCSIL